MIGAHINSISLYHVSMQFYMVLGIYGSKPTKPNKGEVPINPYVIIISYVIGAIFYTEHLPYYMVTHF